MAKQIFAQNPIKTSGCTNKRPFQIERPTCIKESLVEMLTN
jgi:hypothetical protein